MWCGALWWPQVASRPKNLSEYVKITEMAMLRTPRTPRPRGGFLRCPPLLCVFKVVLPVSGRLIGVFEVSMDASFHFEWHHRRPCPTPVAGDTAVFVPFNFILFLAAPLSMASVFLSHGLQLYRQSRLSSQEEDVKFIWSWGRDSLNFTNVEGEDKCSIFTSLKRRMFADFRSQCIIL